MKIIKIIQMSDVSLKERRSGYPEAFRKSVQGRKNARIGECFGLSNFGVNYASLPPGCASALMHSHSEQDEFVYVIEGSATLCTPSCETVLSAGMCAGFPKGGEAHQLVNKSDRPVLYLEIGDRSRPDTVSYPNDDLVAKLEAEGSYKFYHKNGDPYQG
ncbi:cupin domain-containing protein [Polycladidibacter hongkongensis]|uniref:cupin domain-containing protein n=1 Tax=Polycladidibacter hongkongensis TaxID=1647556 RepID=UPI0008374C06|nr:cupin domain-containing protein [Pseudovibrio hongkongensis]